MIVVVTRSPFDHHTDSPVCFAGLVRYISCEPGLPVARHSRQHSPLVQVLVSQHNRDDQIIRLAGKMSDVFTFVQDADPLKTIEAHKKTITPLLQQVAECGYFIAEYTKQKNFC